MSHSIYNELTLQLTEQPNNIIYSLEKNIELFASNNYNNKIDITKLVGATLLYECREDLKELKRDYYNVKKDTLSIWNAFYDEFSVSFSKYIVAFAL